MYNDVVELLVQKETKGDVGKIVTSYTSRVIYGEELPINQNEFFKCRESGIRPAVCLRVPYAEYNGEDLLKHNGITYKIYRVRKGFYSSELYCEVRGGIDGC